VFYVKLYVHSLVDKLKWFYENARCYSKIYRKVCILLWEEEIRTSLWFSQEQRMKQLFDTTSLYLTFIGQRIFVIAEEKKPTRSHLLFYCTSYRLNVFRAAARTLLQPEHYCSPNITAARTLLQPEHYCSPNITAARTLLQPEHYCSPNITAA